MSYSVDNSILEPATMSTGIDIARSNTDLLSSGSAGAAAGVTRSSWNGSAAAVSCCCSIVELVKNLIQRMTRTGKNSAGQSTDILTQLSNLLPTGTFMLFQALAPLTTNNGNCDYADKVATGVIIAFLSVVCAFSCFTDSYKAENGVVYYGIVTKIGLWNPSFVGSGLANVSGAYYIGSNGKYKLRVFDFVNATLSVMALAVLTLLTAPVTACYYPHIPDYAVKSWPLVVGALIAIVTPYAPPARNGFGFAIPGSATPNSSTTTSLLRSSSTASTT